MAGRRIRQHLRAVHHPQRHRGAARSHAQLHAHDQGADTGNPGTAALLQIQGGGVIWVQQNLRNAAAFGNRRRMGGKLLGAEYGCRGVRRK